MGRIVHYLMGISFVVLVMISSISPSCQACLGPLFWGRGATCLNAMREDHCTKEICPHVCEANHIVSNRAFCKKPKRRVDGAIWLCCCPR
ncbi:hypothetical protein PVAP13_7KG100154 [Panicum virgatum]|uniref:Secreted protein n=1 Tax=Panicum virgatum TaxID=38727 RepID=A0A8T0QAC6_PANVG|nr:hypothetical protein PVAP13_7KG100154 [Panicum virgatum]